ncbi:MAG TPA: hypothetical protein ENJ41_01825 [Oceanospirillales bacterium]|nr:hypothetical protein [Oceanospirillales bacterium]
MRTTLKQIFAIVFITLTFNTIAMNSTSDTNVTLKKGTMIPVRLAQNINGNLDNQGDRIFFEVINDVTVKGHVVVPKGSFVTGKITNAETRKSMGKAGKLTIDARSVNAIDGQAIRITREAMTNEGRKRTGATVAHVIMWGPLGLFAKGRAARISRDSEYDVEVDSDITINTSAQPLNPEQSSPTDLDVKFKKYKSKINYAKGKVGKDFTVFIHVPESSNISANDVTVIKVAGHTLPVTLNLNSLEWDKKAQAFKGTIDFKELVKYINPGASSVTFQVKTDDAVMVGDTTLETKWKLK